MTLFYLDTSAALKLLTHETHSQAFARFYDANSSVAWVSSSLLRIELVRAVARAEPAAVPDARNLLLAFNFVGISDTIVEAAMAEPDRSLRSLDAIHLATARTFGNELSGFATYDDRLAAAAANARMEILSPRD